MAKLTAADRKKIPASKFGLPGQRKYPMPDKGHVKSALAYAKHDATPAEQKEIRSKAKKLFPGMHIAGDPSKVGSLASMTS
jgi:hypothetical protein